MHSLVVYWIVNKNVKIGNAHFGVLLQQARSEAFPLDQILEGEQKGYLNATSP